MLGLALLLRERLVGHVLDDVLQERVLAALGRAGVGLDREDLLAQQPCQQRLELGFGESREGRQAVLREGLPQHGAVLDEPALIGRQAVEAGGDQRMQRLRHLERLDRAGRLVDLSLLCEQAAVEEHAHRLDRVQRHALRSLQDATPELVRQSGNESGEQLFHRLRRQWLEVERGEVALASAPGGSLVGELRPGEHEHEHRMAPGPLEQVLEEVEQPGVRPLHVLEDEDDRVALGQPLEEDPPGREEVLLVAGSSLLEPEQVSEARLDPVLLVRIRDVLLDRGPELSSGRRRLLVLDDVAAHPHHLRERPVGDALPVGEAATAVPPGVVGQPVDVLEELPGQARLADAGDARDRDELRLLLVRGAVEQLLDQAQLAVAADEGRLETRRLQRPGASRRHSQGVEQDDRLGLALQLVGAHILVGDRRLRSALRRLTDQHRARLGRRLDTRRRVDQVAGDHALAPGAERDRRLAGEHAGARLQTGTELRHRGDEFERGAHRPLGVVFVRGRCAPDGHDRVADELLDRAAVALDHRPRRLEVLGEELPRFLGVPRLGQRREADQVGEEDGNEPALRRRGLRGLYSRRRTAFPVLRCKRSPALAAELLVAHESGAAGGARNLESRSAFGAELLSLCVRGSAAGADHAGTSVPATRSEARSSHGLASSCSKISRASASSGSASACRSWPTSHSPNSSCVVPR